MRLRAFLPLFFSVCFLVAVQSAPNHSPLAYIHEEGREEIKEFWTPERRKLAKWKTPLLSGQSTVQASEEDACEKDYGDVTDKTDYTQYPLSAVGILFFTLEETLYQCSASIARGNYIWTAGHCLYDPATETYSKKVHFIPGYFNGNAPYKEFPLQVTYISTGWKTLDSKQSLSYDYAMGALFDDVEDVVGFHFDLVVNLVPTEVEYGSVGYPVQSDGKSYIHSCISGTCGRDDSTFPSPLPVQIRCDSKGGSSGGPWLFQQTGDNSTYFIAGVNSYSYVLERNSMYGPYFNSDTNNFFLSVTSGSAPSDHNQTRFLWSVWFFVCVSIGAILLILVVVGILRAVTPRQEGFNYANLT